METIILDTNGLRNDAVVLAADSDRMRIVLRDGNDTIELRRDGNRWITENGSAVELEAWISSDRPGMDIPSCDLSQRIDEAFGVCVHAAKQMSASSGSLSA
jgi:hypothetical protein